MSVSSPRAFLARGGERRRLRTKVPRRSLGPRVALTHGPGRRVAAFDLRALGVRGGRTIHGRCSSGDAFYRSCARALSTDHFLAVNFSSFSARKDPAFHANLNEEGASVIAFVLFSSLFIWESSHISKYAAKVSSRPNWCNRASAGVFKSKIL